MVFGCIDPGNSPAPSVDSVKRRVAGALEHLSPYQVWLAPDCGLMTISRELATQKLKVMVEAAQSLRRQVCANFDAPNLSNKACSSSRGNTSG